MTKLSVIILSFITGIIAGAIGYSFLHTCPQLPTPSVVVERTETTDTTTNYTSLAVTTPAKLSKIAMPNSAKPENSPFTPGGEGSFIMEEVAAWDTVTNDGFAADIKYFTKQKVFKNKFTIPTKTVTKTVTETKTINNVQVLHELPRWELGVGAKTYLKESMLHYQAFTSLTYNTKLWFLNISIEGKGNLLFQNKTALFNPELEAKLKLPL